MNATGRISRSAEEKRPHVVAVSGSRRQGSYTRRALQEVISGVEASGGTAGLLDLAELHLPVFNPDVDAAGDGEVVRQSIRGADAVILGSPMYHGSYSAVLKNAIDYCGFDEFEYKTVGLLVVSGGLFPTAALDHLRGVCGSLNAWVIPHQAAVPKASSAFDEDGLTDDDLRERVWMLGKNVVEYARIEPEKLLAAPGPEV